MGEIDNKKWIYKALVGKGVNMGSYQDFETNLDANKEWVYNTAKEQGLDMGDYDSFNEAVSTSSPTAAQEFEIVSPTIKMPQSNLAKGTMFEGKSLSQRASDKIGSMPISSNALFDISVDKYKQEKAWINELQNDPSISSEVKQSILDDYNNNTKSDEYELKDRDLPPTAKEWLARNKEEVTKRRWIPANHKLGEAGYWQEYTEKVNTPEQIEFIKDYMTNSAEGQEYAKSHKDFIAGLENQIDPLLNQIAEIQRASEESKEEYAEKHNISTYALKNTNPQGKALLDKAANLLKETKLRLSANQQGGGFSKGFHFTNEDLKELAALTEGFYNDKALNKTIDKYENDPESLTQEENIVIQAKYIADQLAAGVDPGSWYNIGQATRQSIPFMRDFMLTTPFGVGAANLAKSAASKLIGKLGAKTLSGGVLSKLGKGAIDFTVRPGVQTMFQPSSYAMAFKEMQGQAMDQGDDGKIQFGNRKSFVHGMTSAGIENQAEVLGEIFLDKIFQKLRLPAPAFLKTNAAKKLSHATGIQGLGSEGAEEKYSEFIDILRGEQTIEEFLDPRSNLETLGTVAVMQVPFKSINATGYGIGKIKDVQAKKAIRTAYSTSLNNLNNSLGAASIDIIPFVNEVIDSGINDKIQNRMAQIIESNNLTDDQKRSIVEYTAIYSVYSGINKAKTEEVEQITQEVSGAVQERINPAMDALISATIAGVDTPIQITGGKIVQYEDGSIDRKQSDREVYYTDADGQRQVVSIQFVEAINEIIPAQDAISLATEQVSAPIIAQQENEEAEPRNVGDTIRAAVNGERFTGRITDIDASTGNYIIEVNSPAGIASVSIEPRHIINEANLVGIEPDNDVMYYDAEGNIQTAKVDDMESMYASGLISLDNGAIIPIEDIIGRSQPIERKNDNAFSESKEGVIPEQTAHDNTSESQNSESVIPVDKKGNLLYHHAPIEATLADLNDGALSPEEVDSFITANQTQVGKLLDKVKKTPPKIGTNKAKYLADKKAWEDKVDDTQAQADYWKQVAEEVSATREQPGDVTAEAIRSMGDPMNGEELAAMMLGSGNLPILYDSYKKETGGSNSEARGMVGLFATKANGGMTIEEAGEQLMLADLENGTNFFDPNDPNAGRNTIIDVLSGARTRGDLFTYIQRSRESMAEREQQAEYEAYEAWCEENFHMTPAEYEAYETVIAEDLAKRALTDEEYQEFMSIFVETSINNSNEQQGINRESETGSRLLPEEEPIPSGRTGGIEESSAEVNGSVSGKDGTLSESTSGEVNIDEKHLNNSEDIVSSHSNNRQTNSNNAEVSESVPQGEYRTLSEKDREHEEASYQLRRRIEEASANASTGKKRRNSEQEINRSIETHAKELGMWIPIQKISTLGHPFLNGNENEVYLDNEKNVVFKVNNLVNSQTLLNLFKRIDLHNEIFPQTKYELVGITGFGNGSTVYPIYKQDFVSKANFAIPEDINNYMASLGFKKSGEGKYSNEDITISDLYPRNVLKDSEGDIYVIDAEFKKENRQTIQEHIAREEAKTDTNPTEAQKEAGNYQKGHIKIDGFDITIENPKRSQRSGVDAKGKPWSITMNNTYGYIRETEGVDGDHIDVFLSNNPEEGSVYIVDQINEDGSFDEHKVMYGFGTANEAQEAYMANYSPGWKGLGNITGVSKEAFKEWIVSSHRKTKPFAEYKIAQERTDVESSQLIQNKNDADIRFRNMKTYHGSGASFDQFDTSHFGEGEGENMIGKGVYTTKSKKIAKNYANVAKNKGEEGNSHLYEVEIPADNGSNYLDYDKRYNTKEMEEIAKRLFDAGTDIGNIFDTYFQSRVASGKNIHKVLSWNIPEGRDVNQILSKAGYVGYKYSTRHDLGGKEKLIPEKSYVVFDQDKASIVSRKQIESQMKGLSDALQTPVRVIRDIEELPEGKARRAIETGRKIKGWYDPQTKEVVVYLPNAESAGDAVRTVLHEVVGHKGLRQLFGEKEYDGIMKQLHARLPKAIREEVADTADRMYKGDIAVAMDEYLAEQAEKDKTPSWWNKVVSSFKNFLRKMGIAVELSGNDVKYLLWRSRKNLQQGNLIDYAEDVAMRNKLGIAQFRDEKNDRYSIARQSVTDFTSRYNSADVLVIKNADTAIEQAKAAGITNESALTEIKEVASDGDTSAVYSPHYDKILIFAENGSTDYESSLFHENFHRAIDKLGLSDAEIEGLFEAVYSTKKEKFDKAIAAYKAIGYNEIKAKEECVVYSLEAGIYQGFDTLFNFSKNRDVLDKILNYIGYDEGKEQGRRLLRQELGEDATLRDNEISQGDGKDSRSRGTDSQRIRGEDAGERTEGESTQGVDPKRYREDKSSFASYQGPLPEYTKPPKLADYGGDIQQFLKAYAEYQKSKRETKSTLAEEVRRAVNKVDGFITNEIDAQAPVETFLKVLTKNGGKVSKKSDPYSYSFLSKGSSTFINETFEIEQIKSLTRALSKIVRLKPLRNLNVSWSINNVKLTNYQKAHLYLQAKDIQEGIELGLPDRGEQAFIEELGTAHTDYIENFEDAVGVKMISELWERVNAATQFTLDMQLQAGLIERETYDTYNERKYYVPERGWNEREIADNKSHYMNLGGSMNGNPYNSAMLKARGRSSLADNPLPYIQSIAHSTVLSVFKNNTKLRAYNLVLDNLAYGRKHKLFDFKQTWFVQTGEIDPNGNPLYEEVYSRPDKEMFDAKMVRVNPSSLNIIQRTSGEKEQHLVKVIKDGKQYVLEFADERVANALNRNSENDQAQFGESVAKWTRAMSALMTQYNPSFALWNLARDTGTGLVSNLADFGIKYTSRFAKNMVNPHIHQAIGQYVFKSRFDKNEHSQLLYDFFMDGAATGWSYLNTIDQLKTDLKKAIDPSMIQQLWGSKYNLVNLEALKFVFGGITEYSELIVRFSEYCTSREMGYTREEAATHAKEVSVNFDRKGSKQNIKSLFAFYNASIQGVNKFARLYCKSKQAKKVLQSASISLIVGGFLNTLFAPDDPDEERAWGEYDRMQNILIGNARIPLPQFLRLFWGFGVQAALAMRGEKTITQAAFDGVINAFDESLPINVVEVIFGFDEKANSITIFSDAKENLRPIIPTTITPMYDVFTNTTFSGGSVYKEPFMKSQEGKVPQSFLGKRNVHPLAQAFSNSVLELDGGDRNIKSLYKKDGSKVSSMFDVNPSVIEHLATGYIPGVGKFISDLSNTAISAFDIATGDEDAVIDQTAIPVWNRIVKPYREDKVFFGKFMNLKDITEGYLHGFKERYKAGKNGTLNMDVITKESKSDAYKLYVKSLEVINGIEDKNKIRSMIESLPKEKAKAVPESLVKQAEVNKEDIKKMNSLLREWREIR